MKLTKALQLSLLSGLLLGLAWFPPFTFLIFCAWIPLLFLIKEINENAKRPKGSAFIFPYITFVTWNTIVTWWTWYASPGGSIAAILANSLLMAFAFWVFFLLYRIVYQRNRNLSEWLLVPVWLSFEYLHTTWDLAWTWLTLGNIFAYSPKWIQWYEYTGVSGGSLWVLAINILAFQFVQFRIPNKITFFTKNRIYFLGAIALLPILISKIILTGFQPGTHKNPTQNIVIVQPNIDPYNDKFNSSFESQLQLVYDLVKGKVSEKTDYLVLPETFFTENVWENRLEESYSVKFLRDSLLRKFPKLKIITGASTFYHFKQGEKLSATAHKYSDADEYYDVFNTALQIDNDGPIQVYHKSKLVPGVERMPYPAVFGFLEKMAIDLGGTSGSLGTQEERGVFFNERKTVGVAPVICYESVFGEYISGYFKNGANSIFIITNDGWWRDSPGYGQHLNYGRLRAIETRTPIARCANTGISCFITETGDLQQETKWWEPAVISGELRVNNEKTFYVKYGDLLSKAAIALFLISLAGSFLLKKR